MKNFVKPLVAELYDGKVNWINQEHIKFEKQFKGSRLCFIPPNPYYIPPENRNDTNEKE